MEFRSEEDADYAIKIINMVKLFGKPMRVNKSSQDKKKLDVGANLFIGGLDDSVDEKQLYDTFSAFGTIVQPPKVHPDQPPPRLLPHARLVASVLLALFADGRVFR